jgi:hypothetical protein
MSWNLVLQINKLVSSLTVGLNSNLRINSATSNTTFGILDCASISANRTNGTLVLTNYAGLTGLTLDSSGNINIPTNLTLSYLNSAKTLTIGSITAYSFPASPSDTISIGITTPVAYYLYAGMYVTISLTSNPVFNGRYKILSILSSQIISIENPAGILQGTTSLGGNLDFGYVGANDIVASGVVTANRVVPATQTNTASASVTLSNTSAQYQLNTRAGGATYILPNATTLNVGTVFHFNANSAGSVVIQDYATTTLYTAPNGAIVEAINLMNATSAGTWDLHAFAPSNVTWGTANLAYSGNVSISGATRKISVQGTHLGSGAGNLGGNIVLGSSTSGNNLTGAGLNNTIVGTNAGNALTTGNINVLIGEVAGATMTTGYQNVAIGAGAMAVGVPNTGYENVAVGLNAGNGITTGFYNTYVGKGAGSPTQGGAGNVAVGHHAGVQITAGDNNVCVGRSAGYGIQNGSQNICIGFSNTTLSSGSTQEVVIGNNITGLGSNQFFMKAVGQMWLQSGGTYQGINCGFSASEAYISSLYNNGAYYIWDYGKRATGYGNPAVFNWWRPDQASPAGIYLNNNQQFAVAYNTQTNLGTTWAFINGLGATKWDFPSDARLKNSIVDLPSQTEKLMKLRPVNYKFNSTPNELKYGFIAQDVKEVYPEFISIMPKQNPEDEDYYGMGLPDFVPCLVKVAQEQQAEITDLKAQLASLKSVVDALVASTGHLVV